MSGTVILTRPKGLGANDRDLVARFASIGVEAVTLESLIVEPRKICSERASEIQSILTANDWWVAFLSPNSVAVFEHHAKLHAWDLPGSAIRIAVQGSGTAAVAARVFQRRVDFEAKISTAEAFAEQFSAHLQGQGRVLIPQSAQGRDVFGPLIEEAGNRTERVVTYGLSRCMPDLAQVKRALHSDQTTTILTFMSPSAVRATMESFPNPDYLRTLRSVSIGPSTSAQMRELGLTVWREAFPHSEEGVVDSVLAGLKGSPDT